MQKEGLPAAERDDARFPLLLKLASFCAAPRATRPWALQEVGMVGGMPWRQLAVIRFSMSMRSVARRLGQPTSTQCTASIHIAAMTRSADISHCTQWQRASACFVMAGNLSQPAVPTQGKAACTSGGARLYAQEYIILSVFNAMLAAE